MNLGNPGMPDSRKHQASVQVSRTFRKRRFFSFDASYNATLNNVVTRSTYDKTSGVTTSQKTTVSGHWSLSEWFSYSMPFGKKESFTLSLSGNYNFTHSPAYSQGTEGEAIRRIDKMHNLYVSAEVNYRHNKLYAGLRGYAYYNLYLTNISGQVRNDVLRNTYSAFLECELPLGIQLRTNVRVRQILGYESEDTETLRTIWNANLSRSFLKKKNLTVMLECSDILNQRNMQWVSITSDNKNTGYTLCVGRYLMAHLIYRFSTKKN